MGPYGARYTFGLGAEAYRGLTWTPRIPKIMKKAQQMTTMFPMGFRDDMRVSTTSFSPWARLMTLWGQVSTKAVLVLFLPSSASYQDRCGENSIRECFRMTNNSKIMMEEAVLEDWSVRLRRCLRERGLCLNIQLCIKEEKTTYEEPESHWRRTKKRKVLYFSNLEWQF